LFLIIIELLLSWSLGKSFLPLWQSARKMGIAETQSRVFAQLSKSFWHIIPALVLFISCFLVFGSNIAGTWTSHRIQIDSRIIVCSSVWLLIYAISLPIAYVMNGLAQNRFNIVSALLSTFANVTLSMYLTRQLKSPIGTLLGSSIAQLFFFLLPFAILHKKIMLPNASRKDH
jgi:hypothetical protein